MYKQGVGDFKYYVGISSLAQIATREDRVCVLNILGGESSEVTPVGHAYSGGNVVFGTSPGRRGAGAGDAARQHPGLQQRARRPRRRPPLQLRRGLPAAVGRARRRGRADPRQSRSSQKIFIVTEKIVGARCARDPRDGPAERHRHLRRQQPGRGRCLEPGAHRRRARRRQRRRRRCSKGSIAIFSNSGNFTTTIATYLRMAGWGTTTLISSGKDVYIHYAAPEFAFALANDARTKAAVLYVEPGGYYELRRRTSPSRSSPASWGAGRRS